MEDGLVRVVVGDDGRLVDLVLDRELLDRPAWAVAEAVVAAVNEAQDAIRARRAELADPGAFAAALDEANLEAERRLAEFGTMVSDLSRYQRGAR
jgi:YbaB/EbfC DNA-binding family